MATFIERFLLMILFPSCGNPDAVKRTIPHHRRTKFMLWTIFVILLVLWLVGLVSFHAIGWYIHILLVIALVVLIIQLITGRRPV
jgi:fatty acid desaturase